MLHWPTNIPVQIEGIQSWNPSPEQRAKALAAGISFQLRVKDGGADRRDEYYWMAWYFVDGNKMGQAVDNWEDVLKLAKENKIKLED